MNEIIIKLNKQKFIPNINKILDTDPTKFPCADMIPNIMLELDKLRTKLIKKID